MAPDTWMGRKPNGVCPAPGAAAPRPNGDARGGGERARRDSRASNLVVPRPAAADVGCVRVPRALRCRPCAGHRIGARGAAAEWEVDDSQSGAHRLQGSAISLALCFGVKVHPMFIMIKVIRVRHRGEGRGLISRSSSWTNSVVWVVG
jgi:hypothetical protein